MQYKFHACGHPNILATHKTTLEFTKDSDLSLRGNCIAGVKADFDLDEIKNFVKKSKGNKIRIIIETDDKKIKDAVMAELNPAFAANNEFVIRKTDFVSERTFAIKADKAAFELKKGLIDYLKDKKHKISVVIENKQKKWPK